MLLLLVEDLKRKDVESEDTWKRGGGRFRVENSLWWRREKETLGRLWDLDWRTVSIEGRKVEDGGWRIKSG